MLELQIHTVSTKPAKDRNVTRYNFIGNLALDLYVVCCFFIRN